MFLIRPVKESDIEAVERFALASSLGIVNLPKNRQALEERIQSSIEAFHTLEHPASYRKTFLFILENSDNRYAMGISGIYSRTGVKQPTYFFRLETHAPRSSSHPFLPVTLLTPISYHPGPTEICSLYLLPEFRQGGLGRLLSLSRFLFIAAFEEHFTETIIAEMRGVIRPDGTSPFWNAVGRHFLDLEFAKVMRLLQTSRDWIPAFLPDYSIPKALLPKEAQEVIGKTHPNTLPALQLLTEQGFKFAQEVDIFDAGPKISAKRDSIRAISDLRIVTIDEVADTLDSSEKGILSNRLPEFRACMSTLTYKTPESIVIPTETAEALQVKIGDTVQILPKQKENR